VESIPILIIFKNFMLKIKVYKRKKSDVDLIVEFDLSKSGKNFHGLFDAYMKLSEYLENLLGRKIKILTPISVETMRIKKVAKEIKKTVIYV